MSEQNFNAEQPKPTDSGSVAVWDVVIEDVANQVSKLKAELDGIEGAESEDEQIDRLELIRQRIETLDRTMADMRQRDDLGRTRYGTRLQPHNGRDALIDAYQESLDLAVYLRQKILERKDDLARIKEAAIKDARAIVAAEFEGQVRRLREHLVVCLASSSRLYHQIAQ